MLSLYWLGWVSGLRWGSDSSRAVVCKRLQMTAPPHWTAAGVRLGPGVLLGFCRGSAGFCWVLLDVPGNPLLGLPPPALAVHVGKYG